MSQAVELYGWWRLCALERGMMLAWSVLVGVVLVVGGGGGGVNGKYVQNDRCTGKL